MPLQRPSPGLIAITAVSVAAFLGLSAWGWGDLFGLFADPARASALVVVGLLAVASLFSGIHLGGCVRADSEKTWLLAPLAIISLGIAWLPAYCDRRDWGTIDGEFTRWVGFALLAIGGIFRVGPMFVLGRRFTWPLAGLAGHRLETTGFYRFVRHPSYAGAFVGGIGWVLVFRSGFGLGLIALLLPAFLPVVWDEERLLLAEHGAAYSEYRRRTWRLVPFLY